MKKHYKVVNLSDSVVCLNRLDGKQVQLLPKKSKLFSIDEFAQLKKAADKSKHVSVEHSKEGFKDKKDEKPAKGNQKPATDDQKVAVSDQKLAVVEGGQAKPDASEGKNQTKPKRARGRNKPADA